MLFRATRVHKVTFPVKENQVTLEFFKKSGENSVRKSSQLRLNYFFMDGTKRIHFFVFQISSIFDKCSMLLQTIWPSNHTSNPKVYFNKFAANAFRDNIGSKKNQPLSSEK
jgi:hypothetical protein